MKLRKGTKRKKNYLSNHNEENNDNNKNKLIKLLVKGPAFQFLFNQHLLPSVDILWGSEWIF